MKKVFRVLLFTLTLMIILTGCGRSIEKDLLGAWKFMYEDEVGAYVEFSEERIVLRSDLEDTPETVDYRVIDLQKGRFIIEAAELGTTTYIVFLEGEFEKKDKIKITRMVDSSDKTLDLIRVKDLEKEMEQDWKKKKELAAKEEKEQAEKEKEEEKKAKEEKAEKEEKERAEVEIAEKEAENDALEDKASGNVA